MIFLCLKNVEIAENVDNSNPQKIKNEASIIIDVKIIENSLYLNLFSNKFSIKIAKIIRKNAPPTPQII